MEASTLAEDPADNRIPTRREQRAAETRAIVLEAATTLFAERGWAATGMRDIAAQAGVAVQTVYASFASKSDVLLAAIDVGVVGDTRPVRLSDRSEFAALALGSVAERVAVAARMLTGINQRTWGLRRALGEGAGGDPALEAKRGELQSRRRDNIRQGLELVTGTQVEQDVVDAVWVVTDVDAFDLVTRIGGRSVEDYERWLAATIHGLLERR
jgi:AcrR family transcriptional regulator